MPVNVNRIVDSARASKPNAVIVGSALKATGLLPRSLPKTTRSVTVRPERAKRPADAAPAVGVPVPAAMSISPSFARMAACMRFRGYIGS